MREINECTAEVFRRSEKRIKERRRNRNRILMCCVPLLICITVFSVAVLPAMMPASKSSDEADEENMAISDLDGSIACSFYSVEIKNRATDDCRLITDKSDVDRMYFALLNVCDEAVSVETSSDCYVDNPAEDKNYGLSVGDSEMTDFEITFKTIDGADSVYRLAGNTLFCVETEQTVSLSDEQLANLTEVFEIPN